MTSLALMAIVVAVWAVSCWRFTEWGRFDQEWVVIPATGMQELHETHRAWIVIWGRFEMSRTKLLRAVIPAGSSATTEPQHESNFVWQPVEPTRVRSWEKRWHLTDWNEWRLGGIGWFTTTGGGQTSRVFTLPLWIVMMIVGTPCWFALARRAKAKRRRNRGLCPACAYPVGTSPVCTECGKPVTPKCVVSP